MYGSLSLMGIPLDTHRTISGGKRESTQTHVLYVAKGDVDDECTDELSVPEPPPSEWSSLEVVVPEENSKITLMTKGLYTPPEPEICAAYIPMSDSDVLRHEHFTYLSVTDPGIERALLEPEDPIIYPEDGQKLYKALCAQMNTYPVDLFYRNLLNNEINLSYYGVENKGVRAMAMALRYNKYVRCLNLTDNFLNDDACFHLGELLRDNCTLEELNLTGCRIGVSGLRRVGKHLRINRKLNNLNLSRNCLTDDGGEIFANQMYHGGTVQRVNVSHNELSTKTARGFITFLEFQNCLTHLDLSWNTFIHVPTLTQMLDHIGDSDIMEELNLSWSALEGKRVAQALQKIVLIPALRVLNLSHNRLHGEAIELIIAGLTKAKHLITFDLSFNPLSLDDVHAVIMKMLRPLVKIENLNLENICVDNQFMVYLERVRSMKVRKNFVITYGDLVRNWIVPEPDPRRIILRRAYYLGHSMENYRIDVPVYFLKLKLEFERSILVKDLIERTIADNVPLDVDLLTELSYVFPGQVIAGSRSVDLVLMKEFIRRLWPNKKHTSALHPHTRHSSLRIHASRSTEVGLHRKSQLEHAIENMSET